LARTSADLKDKKGAKNMRISCADRAARVGVPCALLLASLDASAALKATPVATKAVRAQLTITCAVLPTSQPVITIKTVGGARLMTIEY
jgi:hypothetical protein